jgi:hypothetical protein
MVVLKTAMPIFFLMILVACAPNGNLHGQVFAKLSDTVNYLQVKVIDQKSKFIGQPMSVLLKELSIPIKSFISMPNNNHLEVSRGTDFYFEDRNTVSLYISNRERKPWLYIVWKEPVSSDSALSLSRKYQSNWSNETATYFGKQVVKDILLYQ